MERFLTYLLQAAFTLCVLHGFYRLFIQRETFHRLNRWALLGSLAISALLPAVSIPAIERETFGIVNGISSLLLPVVVSPEGNEVAQSSQQTQGPGFWQVAGWVYTGGCAVLLLRLLVQLAGIFRLTAASEHLSRRNFRLVISERVHAPFSFFRYIFLNPRDYNSNASREILDHEEVHAGELHSIDNLLSELYAIVFWFNPVSWWHKKEIMLNLEYLADKGALQKGCEPETYQLQLLKASLHDNRYALANHFAQSVIKRRIKMMNTRHSPLKRVWKYLLFLPAAAAALFLINCSNDINNEPPAEEEGRLPYVSLEEVVADPDTTQNGRTYNFAIVDKKPVFPGGNDRIMDFIIENIVYPSAARGAGIEGTVYVQFTIDQTGILRDIKAVRGQELGGGLAQEAVRVVGEMPAWAPGEDQGEKVMVSYTLPILFKLGEETSEKRIENPPGIQSFATVDKKPQFPGGNDKIMQYVSEHFSYPSEAREAGIEGTVYIQFTIDKDGSISGVEAVRGKDLGGGLAEEATRVVESMPTWVPGEKNGETVAVSYTLPIFARLGNQ